MQTDDNEIEARLGSVRAIMAECLKDSRVSKLIPPRNNIVGSGKMLRARLALSVGEANGVGERDAVHAAAAVEIIHGASLLHDDVIDGGVLRRGARTFWKKHGTNGAILLGDLLVLKSFSLLADIGRDDLLRELLAQATNVCRSEVEQELVLRGTPGTWAECEQIARAKTGSLFAFAAVAAAADVPGQADALREAGFLLGTAYQLADDILDDSGNEALSGKTLGRDQERGKTTAMTATRDAPEDPAAYIDQLLETSARELSAWPDLEAAWEGFLAGTIRPLLRQYLSAG